MNQTRARIAQDGPVAKSQNGAPLIELPDDWQGPAVQRFVLPGDAESGPMHTGIPTLFVSTSGAGTRWYRTGVHVRELDSGPFVDTYSASYERDHARWKGVPGESIGVRLPTTVLHQYSPDISNFDLETRYNVSDPQLAKSTMNLADELQGGLPNGRLFAEGLSLTILGWLSTHYSGKPLPKSQVRKLSELQKSRLRDFVTSHIGQDLSILELSTEVGMSAYHFTRLFKNSFDMPPHQYVLQRRVELAAMMLRRLPDRPIAEIALALGFASQAHFATVFRRTMGMTPSSWRFS